MIHKGNDLYFNVDARQFIKYASGEFPYNYILNEYGSKESSDFDDAFKIYNKNNEIDVGQRSLGPDSKVD